MSDVILLKPRRSFYLASAGRHFRPKETVIRADDPWFDKGGPLDGAREDFVPINANAGAYVHGGPEPQPAGEPVRRGPGRPKGSSNAKRDDASAAAVKAAAAA